MSATIQARGVGASFGARALFGGLDLVVAPGDVIGLVGPNGAGKTTLLRILAGVRRPDAGTVTYAPRSAHVGYLTQQPDARPGETIRDQLARRTGVAEAHAELDAAAHALADPTPAQADAEPTDRYSDALESWLALGGADFDERLDVIAAELGLTVDLDRTIDTLSGGQAARVGLAALLLSRYDAYLLDEPTNDLDADGLALLEQFVQTLDAPAVVVSHDREFLTRTVTAVLEIDRSLERVVLYGGGYAAYLDERTLARRHAREAFEDYAARRTALQERARMQRAWMDKGTKNAVRKAKKEPDKNIRHHAREASEKQAAKARQTERLLERLTTVDEPRKEWTLQFSIAAAPRSGDVVASCRAAVVRRGDFTLGPVDLELRYGDRVAVTGPNGAGKSTLIELLLGRLAPTSGSAQLGGRVEIGEVEQARSAFVGELPLGDTFGRLVPDWPTADVRTLLAKFGLGAEQVPRTAASLSPGERTRAALALLQARGVNLLVLDEPTNHLDLPAIEQLESALDGFEGSILLVTHDRRMLETVRLTRRLHVDSGRLTEIDAPAVF